MLTAIAEKQPYRNSCLFACLFIRYAFYTIKQLNTMKLFLRILLFTALVSSFASCIKTVESAPPPPVTDPLLGSWYLYDASESYGNIWYSFNAGINGVVSFYENGDAQYDDGNILMQGYWYTIDASDGYYDEYGNYYTEPHQSFVASFKGSGGSSLDLYFDDISFAGRNQFTGTYYTGKSIERYTFKRY